jgi:PTS system galactitol-specific IIC component
MNTNDFFGQLTLLPYMGIVPIVIFVLSVLIRQPVKKAAQGAIKVAMGGLSMVALSYFAITYFAPAVAGAAKAIGGPMAKMTLVDMGWSGAGLVLVNPMLWVNILIFAALNVGLILIGVTKTLYVDFPCMWRGGWTGMIVWYVTGSYWWGTLAMMIFLVSDVLIADWNAKRLQDFHEFSDTASFPNSQNAAIIAAPLAWLLARIPGIKDIKWDGEALHEKVGWFAEPIVLGMMAGTVLGLMADIAHPLNALAVGVVAAMMFHVWPMALGVCFEGWAVFNEGLRNLLVKWMKGKREVYVAVDTSVLLGHPTVGISTTLMYPIAFLLAVFVPGVGLFPVISVQIIQWWMAHITGWTRGNVIHNLIICSVVVVLYGWAATAMAGPFTAWLQQYGMIPASLAGVQATNWDGGGDLRIFLLYKLFSLIPK